MTSSLFDFQFLFRTNKSKNVRKKVKKKKQILTIQPWKHTRTHTRITFDIHMAT